MENIREIKNYILFLKKECNLEVTLHTGENERLISASELILFNIHENPQCAYVKSFPGTYRHCLEGQKKIMEKCKSGSFCGTCYAGVCEYVYPIFDGVSVSGFICISGYRNADYTSYIERCSKKFGIPLENLQKNSLCLKDKMPEKAYVDTLVVPLIRMLELAYSKLTDKNTNAALMDKIIRYVNRHYAQNITLKELCAEFSCSRSYISHNFKKITGQSFREYLISVRLQTAKSLLRHSELGITNIAFFVGFNDSNYFSNVFKSRVGMSPRAYRNEE